MRTTTLGGAGPEAGVIGLGCMGMTFSYDMRAPRDEATSIAVIHRALDLGMTLIDTADAYGPHTNEELVGRALAGGHRDRAVLATKVGLLTDSVEVASPGSNSPRAGRDGRPEHVRASIDGSLRRLGTDHVDLFQLHNPRMDAIETDELFAELEALQDEGKLRAFGVALGPAIGWREEGLRALETRPIAALQTVYNLLEQEPGSEFLEAAERGGAGVMARVPTSSGLLEDKYTPETTFTGSDSL